MLPLFPGLATHDHESQPFYQFCISFIVLKILLIGSNLHFVLLSLRDYADQVPVSLRDGTPFLPPAPSALPSFSLQFFIILYISLYFFIIRYDS